MYIYKTKRNNIIYLVTFTTRGLKTELSITSDQKFENRAKHSFLPIDYNELVINKA